MRKIPLSFLSICIDQYPEDEWLHESNLYGPIDRRKVNRHELALARYKMWQPGQRLRIRFLDGESALHQQTEQYARLWLEHANLEFEFGVFPDAEIRITFKNHGYWSLVGTDALKRPAPEPTMCLGGLTESSTALEMQRVVLHEFGHALGCVHEQSSPSVEIPWNRDAVYAYYLKYYGWTTDMVDHNVLKRYSKSEVDATKWHDPRSIMQYPIPNDHTIGDFAIGWNSELSETDKLFIAQMYPKPIV